MEPNIQPKSTKPLNASSNGRTGLLDSYEQQTRELMEKMRQAQRVLIATHEHPDGDAIGSSLALLHALRLQGKDVTAYIPDEAPEYFNFLPGFERLTTHKPDVASYDLVLVLDYTQLYRTHLEAEIKRHPNTVSIDHHYDNRKEAVLNIVVPEAAATAHIISEIFKIAEVPLTHDLATCLLTGVFTDTGSFMHDSTTPDILMLASELMSKGARLSHIARETYQKKDLPSLRIWGRALSRVIVNKNTKAAVSMITRQDMEECGASLDDLSGVVNLLNTLSEASFALLLTEYEPNKIKGSLRSEPQKQVDVSQIARKFGGGGHKLASGFEIEGHIVCVDGTWRILPPKEAASTLPLNRKNG